MWFPLLIVACGLEFCAFLAERKARKTAEGEREEAMVKIGVLTRERDEWRRRSQRAAAKISEAAREFEGPNRE